MGKINNRLVRLRKESKRTQSQLATYLGVSKSAIHNYEHGYTPCPIDVLIKLANLYDVSIDYIVGRTDTPNYQLEPLLNEINGLKSENSCLKNKLCMISSITNSIDVL